MFDCDCDCQIQLVMHWLLFCFLGVLFLIFYFYSCHTFQICLKFNQTPLIFEITNIVLVLSTLFSVYLLGLNSVQEQVHKEGFCSIL